MTYHFETYGCQMNSAESAALELVCKERGWVRSQEAETADLVLINTCSVRVTAETRAFGRIEHYAAIKKKRKIKGDAPITLVIAGCMSSRLGEELIKKYPEVDFVMGTQSRSIFPLILEAVEKGEQVNINIEEEPAFSFSQTHMEEGSFRSFVPIMHGCNNFCSYCIVPFVRGREVSRDPASIIEEIRLVSERGIKEVTLLGQNVNSYEWEEGRGKREEGRGKREEGRGKREEGRGKREKGTGRVVSNLDLNQYDNLANKDPVPCPLSPVPNHWDFAKLLKYIAQEVKNTNIKRIRFLSANPRNFSKETIKVMAENPVFCRHLHLPVQHGSNPILQAMNRGYTRERFLELVREIREAMPGITLSTDILVGFPGETEEDFEKVISLMEEVKFLYSYMYHYNPREGTKAFDLPDRISEDVKKARLSKVIDLQLKQTNALLKERIGGIETVLVEGISRNNADELIARSEKDEMVVIEGDKRLIGSFVDVKLVDVKGNTLRGEIVRRV